MQKSVFKNLSTNSDTPITSLTMRTPILSFRLLIALSTIAIVVSSCGSPDKQKELESLKQQHAEITEKIKSLEKELGSNNKVPQGKVMDVIVTPVVKGTFTHYIDVQGSVDAEEAVDIRPVMAGTVTRINVKEGDVVKSGQVLAETDNEIYIRQLNSLKPQLDLSKELFDRQKRLWEQKIGSEVQYLQAKTQKESIEKQIETIEEQIDMTRIKSPINGTVDFVGLKIGQMAAASVIEPAFRVVNLSSLNVVAKVSESNSGKVKTGNSVKIYFPDLGEETTSKITFTSRTIDPLTRTFIAEASLGNKPGYRPNMVATLRVIDYENPEAIIVPVNLIQSANGESFVYVSVTGPDGKKTAQRRKIEVGRTYDNSSEVLSGLLEGDLLITTGFSDLTEGMELKF